MKKGLAIILTLTMVFGFAAMAAAAAPNCEGTAGRIKRGCEVDQRHCDPWDFENSADYCGDKDDANRAIFKICDCFTDEQWAQAVVPTDTTIDISMEILVNGAPGDNGVYWAEMVGTVFSLDAVPVNLNADNDDRGIGLGLYETYEDACDDGGYDDSFMGVYKYMRADGETRGLPLTGSDEECSNLEDVNRVVKIELATRTGTHGYEIQPEDEILGNASWAIDIPMLRADPSRVKSGDRVSVKICLQQDCVGICTVAEECCYTIFIGTLCCDYFSSDSNFIVYPYFPPANTLVWNLLGMTISNLSENAGEAVVTLYEADGDVGSVTLPVGGNKTILRRIDALAAAMTKTAGTGSLGDSMGYITVSTDFSSSGFAMIADTTTGASMGYLPHPSWIVNPAAVGGNVEEMMRPR